MAQFGFGWVYRRSQIPRWMPAAVIVVGLGMFMGAAVSFVITRNFLATARSVPGVVIDLVEQKSSDGGNTYSPRVRFRPLFDHREIEFVASLSSRPPAYHRGDLVIVLYDPANPEDATIEGFLSQWLPTVVLSFLGAAFVAGGAIARRHVRAQSEGRESDASPVWEWKLLESKAIPKAIGTAIFLFMWGGIMSLLALQYGLLSYETFGVAGATLLWWVWHRYKGHIDAWSREDPHYQSSLDKWRGWW